MPILRSDENMTALEWYCLDSSRASSGFSPKTRQNFFYRDNRTAVLHQKSGKNLTTWQPHDGRMEQLAVLAGTVLMMYTYWSCSLASILHHHLFQRDKLGPTTDPGFLMSVFSLLVSCALMSVPQHIAAKMTVLATTYWSNIWSPLLHVVKDLILMRQESQLRPFLYTAVKLEGPLQFTVQFDTKVVGRWCCECPIVDADGSNSFAFDFWWATVAAFVLLRHLSN